MTPAQQALAHDTLARARLLGLPLHASLDGAFQRELGRRVPRSVFTYYGYSRKQAEQRRQALQSVAESPDVQIGLHPAAVVRRLNLLAEDALVERVVGLKAVSYLGPDGERRTRLHEFRAKDIGTLITVLQEHRRWYSLLYGACEKCGNPVDGRSPRGLR